MKDTNLIIGKKNTGKTRLLFNEVKESIKNNENLLIYDDRDEYYTEFINELKNNGYNILTLNLKDATKSNGFNPLLLPYLFYKENKIDESVGMINDLALEIFKEESTYLDPFWSNMAVNYFTGLVLILFKEAKQEEINIGSIQVMMMQGEKKFEDKTYLKKYLEDIDVTSSIYSLLSPIVFAPCDTKGSILSFSKQKINKYLLREQLLNLLNTNEINLNELKEKTAILVIGKTDVNDLANILINQLIYINNKFTYIIDNLDSLNKIKNLKEFLKDASYYGNKIYVSMHNIEELKEKYGSSIIEQFEIIKEVNSECEKNERKNINVEYPLLKMNNHTYFNFEKFIDNK